MPFDRKDWMKVRRQLLKALIFLNLAVTSGVLTIIFAKACRAAPEKSAPEFFYFILSGSFLLGTIIGIIASMFWLYDAADDLDRK